MEETKWRLSANRCPDIGAAALPTAVRWLHCPCTGDGVVTANRKPRTAPDRAARHLWNATRQTGTAAGATT